MPLRHGGLPWACDVIAWRSVSVAASAIRFFSTHTVKRLDLAMAMPPRRKPRRLPHILSVEEVERVLSSHTWGPRKVMTPAQRAEARKQARECAAAFEGRRKN